MKKLSIMLLVALFVLTMSVMAVADNNSCDPAADCEGEIPVTVTMPPWCEAEVTNEPIEFGSLLAGDGIYIADGREDVDPPGAVMYGYVTDGDNQHPDHTGEVPPSWVGPLAGEADWAKWGQIVIRTNANVDLDFSFEGNSWLPDGDTETLFAVNKRWDLEDGYIGNFGLNHGLELEQGQGTQEYFVDGAINVLDFTGIDPDDYSGTVVLTCSFANTQ